uniref:Uncharacterized protein n=1 Tax=Amphimedon queenslandica TaxID=400682 RepID=A0A1X7TRC1_AMPQE
MSRAMLWVPMESSGQDEVLSIKSGKHWSSFSRYSKAAKVVAAILFWGESYI